jgi:hypothetical protein
LEVRGWHSKLWSKVLADGAEKFGGGRYKLRVGGIARDFESSWFLVAV